MAIKVEEVEEFSEEDLAAAMAIARVLWKQLEEFKEPDPTLGHQRVYLMAVVELLWRQGQRVFPDKEVFRTVISGLLGERQDWTYVFDESSEEEG